MTDTDNGVLHGLFHPETTAGDAGGHEQVVLWQDRASGLKAIIAVHSTALGPALGGTRFHAYANEADALADALQDAWLLLPDLLQQRGQDTLRILID